MKLLFDLSVEKDLAYVPLLLNKKAISIITEQLKNYECCLITDQKGMTALTGKNIRLIPLAPEHPPQLFKRLFPKFALNKLVKRLNPDVIFSSVVVNAQALNCFLLQSHKQLKKINAKHLLSYQYVVVSSIDLKQELLQRFKFDADKIFVASIEPEAPFSFYNSAQQQLIRDEWSAGHQFFLVHTTGISIKQALNLFKAFSIFKKRFQTGMKLIINSAIQFEPEFLTMLSSYKYQEDVLLINETSHQQLNALTTSAYAVICFADNDSMVLPQQIIAVKIPVMMLQTQNFEEQPDLFVYADQENVDDIAFKLMLLYKDETYRKKVIDNAQQTVSQIYNSTFQAIVNDLVTKLEQEKA